MLLWNFHNIFAVEYVREILVNGRARDGLSFENDSMFDLDHEQGH